MSSEPVQATPEEENAPARKTGMSSSRARAEARRKRILQQSKDRMDVIAGNAPVVKSTTTTSDEPTTETTEVTASASEQPSEEVTVDENVLSEAKNTSENAAAADTGDDVNNADADTDVAAVTTTTTGEHADAPASPAKTSTSARMQQMRRRRYRKAAEKKAVATTEEDNSAATTTTTTAVDSNDVQEQVKTENETKDGETETAADADAEGKEKKKYMGVAKMRRRRLKEKKAMEDKKDADEMKKEAKDLKNLKGIGSAKLVGLGPILVQLFTVLVLFLAGFDIGIQNHAILKQDVPNVHTNLSYVDNGFGALSIFIEKEEGSNFDDATTRTETAATIESLDEDEFGGSNKPAGASTTTAYKENIDPVFGVDFDKLTSGGGIFFALARFAVSIHRSMTFFFYTLPLTIVRSLFAFPKRLLTNPPILFLCAIIIRYLGKYVFGGDIPRLDEMIESQNKADSAQSGNTEKSGLESFASANFLAMGKKFAFNWANNNFPRVVMVFTMFKDARADMFVVLCGFFVGLIAPTSIMGQLTSISDEL